MDVQELQEIAFSEEEKSRRLLPDMKLYFSTLRKQDKDVFTSLVYTFEPNFENKLILYC